MAQLYKSSKNLAPLSHGRLPGYFETECFASGIFKSAFMFYGIQNCSVHAMKCAYLSLPLDPSIMVTTGWLHEQALIQGTDQA